MDMIQNKKMIFFKFRFLCVKSSFICQQNTSMKIMPKKYDYNWYDRKHVAEKSFIPKNHVE